MKAAEEDVKVAEVKLEAANANYKARIIRSKLESNLQNAKNEVSNAKVKVETMENALNEANAETSTLRDEMNNKLSSLN